MGFLGICSAIYDYEPQGDNELEIKEGELLYILEKSTEDDWWKAKKRAAGEDEDEPEGLIPNNYVEEARPIAQARALYDYSRQTDEEVSFSEDANLNVYDTSDPDWTLVGVDEDFGFAPSNYIEVSETAPPKSPSVASANQSIPPVSVPEPESPLPRSPPRETPQGPAAALAKVLGGHSTTPTAVPEVSSPPLPARPQFSPRVASDEAEEPAPALPVRPPSEHIASPPVTQFAHLRDEETPGILPSPPHNRAISRGVDDQDGVSSPGGYHLYNINEMQSAMGKRKKLPTTLGIDLARGSIMVSPARARDGETQEWTAEKLQHYSIEGKHVFLDLIKPVRSFDLHAGAKDTAQEIVSALGEIAGASKGEGLREVLAAASGGSQKKGQILYDFMAQGDDEVTVAVGDDVIVIDDTKSDEWWMVRRLKNGKEGVVPSSYVEITGTVSHAPSSAGLNAGRSTVEQNRLEEERLAKEAARSSRSDNRGLEVGPGMKLPERGSSLVAGADQNRRSQMNKRESKSDRKSSKTKPDSSKIRTWTDRSGTFKVEAQFIGLTDGKIHLHKQNGVKIAVPVSKMDIGDLEYVESVTGVSLDEDKPLSDIKRKNQEASGESKSSRAGASIEQSKRPEYDWFDFFLQAGVSVHQCERYAQNFNRDQMDESVLPDITPEVLRTLGLKEGDILRVMKFLDGKYGRNGETNGTTGGLFSGPGGALRNNTRKGRPTPGHQASDVVDPKAFEQQQDTGAPAKGRATPLTSAPPKEKEQSGFDDDAWEVKTTKQPAQPTPATQTSATPSTPSAPSAPSAPLKPALTGAMAELSLLSPPLQPTSAPQPRPQPVQQPPQPTTQTPAQPQPTSSAPPQQSQQTGANPSFFAQINPQQTGLPQQQMQSPQAANPQQQFMPPRQRPQAPQNPNTSSLIAPPPRPASAPQNFNQQNQFGPPPLQPQVTGIPHAPPGQSLSELNQQRFQQQYSQQQPLQTQPTGFPQQGPGFAPSYPQQMMQQPTGFNQQLPQQQFSNLPQQQPYMNGNQAGSPFADPRPQFQPQPTGFGSFNQTPAPQQQPMRTGGINSVLPPALQPQPTGFQPQSQFGQQQQAQQLQAQQTGVNGFGHSPQQFNQAPPPHSVPPLPPMPTQQTPPPLVAQKTGPAPPVRFGVTEPKKLTPQPTGRRANLSQATPQNPFGF